MHHAQDARDAKGGGKLRFQVEVDDLIIAIGYGKITPLQLVRKVAPKDRAKRSQQSGVNRLMGRVRKKKIGSGVVVKGADDILVRFGKCCQPVPGDQIVGYITRGFGVTVHRSRLRQCAPDQSRAAYRSGVGCHRGRQLSG
jgi:(p)ppGpp synthase/HD superfamily hydrolase